MLTKRELSCFEWLCLEVGGFILTLRQVLMGFFARKTTTFNLTTISLLKATEATFMVVDVPVSMPPELIFDIVTRLETFTEMKVVPNIGGNLSFVDADSEVGDLAAEIKSLRDRVAVLEVGLACSKHLSDC